MSEKKFSKVRSMGVWGKTGVGWAALVWLAGAAAGCGAEDGNVLGRSSWAFDPGSGIEVPPATIYEMPPLPIAQGLVIAEFYGGGGEVGAVYSHDYVVLFNQWGSPVNIGDIVLQYAPAADNFTTGPGRAFPLPHRYLQPGEYFLIQMATQPGGFGEPLPDADAVYSSMDLGVESGKLVLRPVLEPFDGCGAKGNSCYSLGSPDPIDLVGYGAASLALGYPVPELSSSVAAVRKDGGCSFVYSNSDAFEVLEPSPRNSLTPIYNCYPKPDAGVDAPEDVPVEIPVPDAGEVVISEIYAGAGLPGAPFDNDFIVLFNRGKKFLELGGMALQFASADGDFDGSEESEWNLMLPRETIVPGYYLIGLANAEPGGLPLPKCAWSWDLDLPLSGGKIALVKASSLLSDCGSEGLPCDLADVIDFVGYGEGASQFEGSGPVVGELGAMVAANRKGGGCQDTDDNAEDFDLGAPKASRNDLVDAPVCEPEDWGSDNEWMRDDMVFPDAPDDGLDDGLDSGPQGNGLDGSGGSDGSCSCSFEKPLGFSYCFVVFGLGALWLGVRRRWLGSDRVDVQAQP